MKDPLKISTWPQYFCRRPAWGIAFQGDVCYHNWTTAESCAPQVSDSESNFVCQHVTFGVQGEWQCKVLLGRPYVPHQSPFSVLWCTANLSQWWCWLLHRGSGQDIWKVCEVPWHLQVTFCMQTCLLRNQLALKRDVHHVPQHDARCRIAACSKCFGMSLHVSAEKCVGQCACCEQVWHSVNCHVLLTGMSE